MTGHQVHAGGFGEVLNTKSAVKYFGRAASLEIKVKSYLTF